MKIIEGVQIIIHEAPYQWSSYLKGISPLYLDYPVSGEVVEVKADYRTVNIKIAEEIYGFYIDNLIRDNFRTIELITD